MLCAALGVAVPHASAASLCPNTLCIIDATATGTALQQQPPGEGTSAVTYTLAPSTNSGAEPNPPGTFHIAADATFSGTAYAPNPDPYQLRARILTDNTGGAFLTGDGGPNEVAGSGSNNGYQVAGGSPTPLGSPYIIDFGTITAGPNPGTITVQVTDLGGNTPLNYTIDVTNAVITPTPTPTVTPVTAVILTCPSGAGSIASLDPQGYFGPISVQVNGGTNSQPVTLTATSSTGGATANQPSYTTVADSGGAALFSTVQPGGTKPGTFTVVASAGGKTSTNTCTFTVTVGQATNVMIVSPTSPTSIKHGGTGSDLRAKVTDIYGNLVGGIPVNFTLTSVTGSPAPTITSTLNCANIPGTYPTANTTAGAQVFGYVDCGPISVGPDLGSFTVRAMIPNGAFDTSAQITVTNGPATKFLYVSGDGQFTPVNTPFGAPLKAIVEDATGHPVDGKLVSLSFTAIGGAGLLGSYPNQLSGSDGVPGEVSFNVIANAIAGGPYPVTLTAFLGANGAPTVTYGLTNTPATSNRVLSLVSGGNTSTAESTAGTVAAPIKIKVTDGSSNPVPNVQVQLFGPGGTGARADFGGGTTSTSQYTDGTGVATFPYNAPCGLGPYYLFATTQNAQSGLSIAETTIAGAASSVQVQSGNPQSTPVNTNFTLPLSVKVLDTCNNPVAQNTTVTFTAVPVGGASLASSPLTAQTDANGIASVTAAANTITGSYTVTAATGTATSATFNLTNTAGPVTSCTFVNGSTPAATVGMTFTPADFAVQALDNFGNAVNNAQVAYMVPATGNPSVTGLTGGNTSGVSPNAGRFTPSAPVTANNMAGSYLVTATANGVACGTRSVTNTAGAISQIIIGTPAAPITTANGFTDSAVIGQFFTKPIPFFVADQYGNPVNQQVTVTFSAPASNSGNTNPTATSTGGSLPVLTGSNGQGTFTPTSSAGFKAINAPGSYNITATYLPISGPAITNSTVIQYTNLATSAASCSFVNPGNTRTAVVGGTFTPLSNFAVQAFDGAGGTGNPVNGAPVTYTVNPVGGATLTGLTSGQTTGTGANAGQFTPTGPLTANNTAGTYTVSAAIGNIPCGSPITVTNTPGTATQLVATSGTPQTAASGATFANLVAQLEDAFGNPVSTSGVVVNFTASPAGCVTNLPAANSVTTTASGQATFTAPIAQSTTTNVACTITATATGVAGTATFTLNITGTGGGGGTGLHLVLLSPIGSPVGVTRSGTSLIVQLQNAANQGVSSPNTITGTITSASDGSQGVFMNGALTQTVHTFFSSSNGAGQGSFVVFATRGSSVYTVTFTASGATPLTVNLRNPQNS